MSTGGTKYIPSNDSDFCDFSQNVIDYASENHTRWGVMTPTAEMKEHLNDFKEKTERCKLPTRSKVDTDLKNEARKILEKEMRNYLQGVVMHNVNVTLEDRDLMRLPRYDTTPTAVIDPVGLATASIKYPNEGALELHMKHAENTPFDAKADYGYRIYFGVYAADAAKPVNGKELRESVFTRQKKHLFTFEPEDSGKTAYFSIRYENSKGKAGQWGHLLSALIP